MKKKTYLLWLPLMLAVACLVGGNFALSPVSAETKPAQVKPAGKITIDAWTFDRGNAGVSENPGKYGDYRDKHPELILTGDGKEPWFVEYDIDFPVTTTFTMHVRYASAGERPIKVWLDDKLIGECCGNVTNNAPPYPVRHMSYKEDLPERTWAMHGAQWEEAIKIPVTKGLRTLKFTRDGAAPNPITIRLESPEKFPEGWKSPKREVVLDRIPVRYRRVFLKADAVNILVLRKAIEDKVKTLGPKYPKGPAHLKQLAELEQKQAAVKDGTPEEQQEVEDALAALRKQAMLDHPALDFNALIFGDTLSKELSLDLGKGVSMKLVLIPAGKFKMGNHDTPAETVKKVGGKEEHLADEYPAHEVRISKPFYMGIYELTQAQWKAVMGTEPWMTKTALGYARAQPRPQGFDDYPAVWLNSYDAIEFCRKLSKKTGLTVSLPTEAQWEYACRAGTTTTFSFGDDLSKLIDYGWYGGIRAGQMEDYAHRVGQRKPNAWGLYDMHGNVWEFCSDWYDKDYYSRSPSVDPENTKETDLRCLRSGSFHSEPTVSRSSQRARWVGPKQVRYNYGIRVVVAADTALPADGDPPFVPLFNGKDLTNFQTKDAAKFWRIEDGVLIGENDAAKKGHYLWTTKKYSDFILDFDAKWKGTTKRGVDTGIELREPKLQLQLGISGSLRVDMTGSFYAGRKGYPKSGQATEAKTLLSPEGEWNSFRLQAKGNTFSCWINGKKASEYTDANFSGAAPLALQIHGGVVMKVEYRNLRIADLAAGEVLSSLNAQAGEIAVKDGETIAFLGDSITAAGRAPGGYCQFVLAALKDQGINTTAVFAGIGGHKSDQMLARLEKDVLNHQPNWMTLSCGVNDVWHGKHGVELEPYKKNITEIVDRAQAAGLKVLLLTSTMIKEDQANELNRKLVAYNDFIRQLAKDKGCLLADVNADMQVALKTPPPNRPDGKKLTSDGVHMNPYGNIMMGRGVAKALGVTDAHLDETEKAWRSVSSHSVRIGDIKLSIDAIETLNTAAKAEGTDIGGLLRKAAEARKDELLK